MTRTSSMIYNPTEESRELFLYTTNDGELYRRTATAIINNLHSKYIKGSYSKEKAVDAYYHLATEGSKKYNKDFGYSFSVMDRFTAAVEMEEYYLEQVQEGCTSIIIIGSESILNLTLLKYIRQENFTL